MAAFFLSLYCKTQIMKTVKLAFLFLCLLVSVNTVRSQNVVPDSEKLLDKLRLNKGIDGIEYETYQTVVGDPFLFKDFHKGELAFKNGETYQLNMRYDIYANQMHLKDNDQIYGIIHPEAIADIVIDTLKFLYCNYATSPSGENSGEGSYFILKTDGKCELLVRKKVRIQDAEPTKGMQEAKPARFVPLDDTYYLRQEGKNAVRIKGKKTLLTVLEDKKEEINKLIKTEKLSTKNETDLLKIVSAYNSL